MTKRVPLIVAMAVVVCTVGWAVGKPSAPPDWEEAQVKVLKVFSAHDGPAVDREYLVSWKDQEVVARDPLVQKDYHVGDTITVLVMKLKYPNGKPGPDLLSFQVGR